MKLTIPTGTKTQDALTAISSIVNEAAEDDVYTKLKSNLNLYIGLESNEGLICPLNDKVFWYKNGEWIDAQKEAKEKAVSEATRGYQMAFSSLLDDVKHLENSISSAKKYLAEAEEKGRKPERIASRQKQLEKDQAEYDALNDIVQAVNNGSVSTFLTEYTGGKNKYDIELDAVAAVQIAENRWFRRGYRGWMIVEKPTAY